MLRIASTLALIALLFVLGERLPLPLFRLPGDINLQIGRLHLFAPLTTCILLSLLVSLAFGLFARH